MKKLITLFIAIACFQSCEFADDDSNLEGTQVYLVAKPLKYDLGTFKEEAVSVDAPKAMENTGKIYAYKDYIFVNDLYQGFHIIDNTNPSTPSNIGFLKLEGNFDISIKNDRLYADSYGDLVVLDISDIENVSVIKRMENAIYHEYWCAVAVGVEWPEADAFDYSEFDENSEALVGWDVEEVRMTPEEFEDTYGYSNQTDDSAFAETSANAASSDATGQGGSFARFRIVGDYLYAVESWSINVFDISDLSNPEVLEEVYTNGNIETIFNQGDILFLGGSQGMYIYDISSPEKPTYVSEFTHGKACDPVVISDGYAFVTLRSGNSCGDTESGLYIVDVSDLKNPTLQKTYPMTEPYGLGIKDEKLFICDGSDGLKVYDKTDVDNLVQLNHFKDIETYDVIPLSNSLLMIGDKVLYQYAYVNNNIELLSAFDLD